MLPELTQKKRLYQLLYTMDQDLAEESRGKGCPHCQGRLHQANYERKPRGGPRDLDEKINKRRSWVSAADAGKAWDLRCLVREKLIEFIRTHHPESLPHFRIRDDLSAFFARGKQSRVNHSPPE